MSKMSNQEFYSPNRSDDFKSVKGNNPFDDKSITPKSVGPFDQNQQPIVDWYQEPDKPKSQQQQTPSSQQKFDFDDFGDYDENAANQSEDVGKASNIELQQHLGIQAPQSDHNKSRDIADIEDLMHNQSQQSNQFTKINPEELMNYIQTDQLPSNPIDRQMIMQQQLQPPFSNFPFLEGISPAVNQMAFTFHEKQIEELGGPERITFQNNDIFQNNDMFKKQTESKALPIVYESIDLTKQDRQIQSSQKAQQSSTESQKQLQYVMPQSIPSNTPPQTPPIVQYSQPQSSNNLPMTQSPISQFQQPQFQNPQPPIIRQTSQSSQQQAQQNLPQSTYQTAPIYNPITQQPSRDPWTLADRFQSMKETEYFPYQTDQPRFSSQKEAEIVQTPKSDHSKASQSIFQQWQNPQAISQVQTPVQLPQYIAPDTEWMMDIQPKELSKQTSEKSMPEPQKQFFNEQTQLFQIPDSIQWPEPEVHISPQQSAIKQPDFGFIQTPTDPALKSPYSIPQDLKSPSQVSQEPPSKQPSMIQQESNRPSVQDPPPQMQTQDLSNNFLTFDWPNQQPMSKEETQIQNELTEMRQDFKTLNLEWSAPKTVEEQKSPQNSKITPTNSDFQTVRSNVSNPSPSFDNKKKSNPFFEEPAEDSPSKEFEQAELPWENDFLKQEEPKKELPAISEVSEDEMSQSLQIANRNSALIAAQHQVDSELIDLTKSASQSKNTESWDIRRPQQQQVKELDVENLIEQLFPKIQQLMTKQDQKIDKLQDQIGTFEQTVSTILDNKLVGLQQAIQAKDEEGFDRTDFLLQKMEMIETFLQAQHFRLEKMDEHIQQKEPEQTRSKVAPRSPFDINLDEKDEELQENPAFPNVKFAQSNYYAPQGFTPMRTQNSQSNVRYVPVENNPNIQKYKTNYQFQQDLLYPMQQHEIQAFKKMCLSDTCSLLETFELFVSATYAQLEENNQQILRVTVQYKNKSSYDLSNFIVINSPMRVSDRFIVNPRQISESYLAPQQTLKQEFKFAIYDPQAVRLPCIIRYQVKNYSMGQDPIKVGASYLAQSRYQVPDTQLLQAYRRSFEFNLARPANKFITCDFITADELLEYTMTCQSEEFDLRSLDNLIIYHPWLVRIDENTVGAKILLHLKEEQEFVLMIKMGSRAILQMNPMGLDAKLTEHLLCYFSYLFMN